MELFRDDDELIDELRALRPEPSQEFTAGLDERAAAGFPRRSSRAGSPLSSVLARLQAASPRRVAFSAGAAALAAIAVATVVVAVGEPKTDSPPEIGSTLARLNPNGHFASPADPARATGDAGGAGSNSLRAEKFGSGVDRSEPQASDAPPVAADAEKAASGSSSSAGAQFFDGSSRYLPPKAFGPYASKAGHRNVERSAEMVLGAEADEVGGDAAKVFDAVHAVDGIVLSSSVTGGAAGNAGARFELLIPSAKLSDALAAFSAIDVVVSRHEATDDITAPTVRVGEHLRDSRATIDGLLVQLAGADSDEERAEVEVELRAERRHAAALRSQGAKLDRRANLSRVSLRIVTDPAVTSSDESNGWGVGDALGDAGRILGIAAGVAIVGLAILAPLASIALLAWLANRARIRRSRERALA